MGEHMTLEPLLTASPVIQIHAFAALGAFALGLVQLAAPKGTLPHRTIGWTWAGLMFAVAITAFWIHEIRLWGIWSPIHLLAILTLVTLPMSLYAARKGRIGPHKRGMIALFVFALVTAGAFTFFPGRIMHSVLTGG